MRGYVLLLALLAVACVKRGADAPPSTTVVWPIIREVPTLRLPAGVTPVSQALELSIDPNADWYSGHTEIDVDVAATTSLIWINGHDLRVSSVTVTPTGAAPLRADYTEHDGSGFASIRTLQPIPAGRARIALRFGAPLREGTRLGVYKLPASGQLYVFTQLQPIAARTVFPCFDEPSFKIPYDVSLIVPREMRAVANAREVSRTPEQEMDRAVFATTEKLPSYLIAFAVGDFDVVEAAPIPANAVRSKPVPLRAFTTKGRGQKASTALGQVGPLLDLLEAYTGIAYAYDKLDIIAVPHKNGAMENPGAITMNVSLLEDATSESTFARSFFVDIMAHELSHLWVGDLVTMAWWDDVWLNEAFATWLGAKVAHAWAPELRLDSRLRSRRELRLEDDRLPSSRAIREPIRDADDIEAAFDRVAYDKGAAVILMFERWLGEEAWQRGIRAYLKKYRHANATTADLLTELSDASGRDLSAAVESFLNNRGAPVVSAALRCEANGGPARVDLSQTRYWPVGSAPDEATWGIPVCVRYGGRVAGEACTLLQEREGSLSLPASAGCPAWALPNADAVGYYYPSVAARDRGALRKSAFSSLPTIERETYAGSVMTDYERGAIPYGEALETLVALSLEEPGVGDHVSKLLGEAHMLLEADQQQARVERYARALYGPVLAKLGYDPKRPESGAARHLRFFVIKCLAMVGRDTALRREAKRRGLRYLQEDPEGTRTKLGPFGEVAFEVVGEDADLVTFDMLVERATAADGGKRWDVRGALEAVRAPEVVAKLHQSLSGESEESELLVGVMSQRFQRPELANPNWDWLNANRDTALRPLTEASAALWPLDVVERLCDLPRIAQAERALPPLVAWVDGGAEHLARAVGSAHRCVAARKVHEPEMRAYFESK